MKLKKSRCDI